MAENLESKRKPMTARTSRRIFLSASIPLPSRDGQYFSTADVISIRDAVRALTIVIMEEDCQLVFGGHPAISPMIRLQIAQTGRPVRDRVVLFQSRFFAQVFPEDNAAFERVIFTDSVENDRNRSLLLLRETMLRGSFICGIFIGGMEGVEEEYGMFKRLQRDVPAFPIASTGAAAAKLFDNDAALQTSYSELKDEFSYIMLMRSLVQSSLI